MINHLLFPILISNLLGNSHANLIQTQAWSEVNNYQCPPGYVYYNDTGVSDDILNDTRMSDIPIPKDEGVCCKPVTCSPGFEIKTCGDPLVSLDQDICLPCARGLVQPNNISSLDYPNIECFERDPSCPLQDMLPAREGLDEFMFPYRCQCDTSKCYYWNGIMCALAEKVCGKDETLNHRTGECEPCPWYASKGPGCHNCQVNFTKLMMPENEKNDFDGEITNDTEEPDLEEQKEKNELEDAIAAVDSDEEEFVLTSCIYQASIRVKKLAEKMRRESRKITRHIAKCVKNSNEFGNHFIDKIMNLEV